MRLPGSSIVVNGINDCMPKISILIPAYNVERYVARSLDSVISQTFNDLEVIVVDDGSTDGTLAVLHEYAGKDPRIKVVVHPENCGVLWTRKTCVEASSGDYLMFVDSDDALKPDACDRLYSEAIGNEADMVVAGYEFRSNGGGRESHSNVMNYGSSSYGVAKAMLKNELSRYVWGRLFQRRLLVDNPPDYQKHINLGDDLIVSFHVARFVRKAVCIPDILYEYYQNSSSLSHVFSPVLIRDNVRMLRQSIELSSAISGELRVMAEKSAIKRIHALIKKRKGVDRRLVMRVVKEEGVSQLFSFKSLLSHLGLRKGLTYYLVTKTDFFSKMA